MNDLVLARVIHVLSLVHWIGGLAFVTLIVLPQTKLNLARESSLATFTTAERLFSRQVRFSIPLAGASGLWMTWRGDLWSRFRDGHYWWMSAMFGLWLIFMAMIFVVEPLLHARFEARARENPEDTLRKVTRLHQILLLFAFVTIAGAVAGSQGYDFF